MADSTASSLLDKLGVAGLRVGISSEKVNFPTVEWS